MDEKIFRGLTRFEGEVHFLQTPKKWVGTFRASDTAPDVSNVEYWIASGSIVSITKFTKGIDGQTLHILGDGTTTLVHGIDIKTNTGANKLLEANKVYIFVLFDGVWYEVIDTSGAASTPFTKMHVTLWAGDRAWTNMTNAVKSLAQPLFNVLNAHGVVIDLLALGATQFRMHAIVEIAGAAAAALFVKYSSDPAFGTSNQLEDGGTSNSDILVTSTGHKVSPQWVDIAAGAKIATCYLKCFGHSSNATNDPVFPMIALEFR